MDCKSFLKEVAVFKDLDDTELDAVCAATREKSLAKNEALFSEGDTGDAFYVVQEGTIAIYKKVAGGKKRILTNMDKGKLFGELTLFDEQPRSAMAEAAEEAKLLVFNITDFRETLAGNPVLASKFQNQIILTLCSRLRDANEKLNQGVIWGFKSQM